MKILYPGTFDPITYGHIDLVDRSLRLFDEVIVAVSTNTSSKKTLFNKEERLSMVTKVFQYYDNVTVKNFDGLLVDFLYKSDAKAILRGLRSADDFEYESQIFSVSRFLDDKFEILFMLADRRYSFLSSTMVLEIARIDLSRIANLVPQVVLEALEEKLTAFH